MGETRADYELLSIFVAVAQENSFSRAARRLAISKGTVSRAIARLEEIVGGQLIHRTTHAVSLSTAGTALYERTASHLAALDQAVHELPEKAKLPSGLLRITAPHDFAEIVLPRLLPSFLRRYPEIRLELSVSNVNVDLVAEGYDLAIRAVGGKMKDSSLTVRKLTSLAVGVFASPAYLARRGTPKQVGATNHEWLLPPVALAALDASATAARVVCNDFFVLRDLARDGLGVALTPRFVAASYVREGLLEELALSHPALRETAQLVMLYPSSGQVSRKVTAFRDFVVEWLTATPLD